MAKKLDWAGALIVNLHQMLGHDKAAAYLGQPPYNKGFCIMCMYEKGSATKADVYEQLGV